jgi:NNP family nitrate/nitrite transporter-like MFS transporter
VPGRSADYARVLRAGWRLYRLAVFYFITFGGFVAAFLLLPTVLQDWFDFSKGEASARAAGFVIAATLARPVGGWLADRYGAYPVLVLVFATVAVCAAVLAAIAAEPRIVPITLAFLTLGTALGAGSGAVFKLVPLEFPHDAGAAAGIVGAAGGLGGFFPPVFVGVVKDAEGTYTYGFVGLLVFTAVCLAGAVWLLRTAPALEVRGVPHGGARA